MNIMFRQIKLMRKETKKGELALIISCCNKAFKSKLIIFCIIFFIYCRVVSGVLIVNIGG